MDLRPSAPVHLQGLPLRPRPPFSGPSPLPCPGWALGPIPLWPPASGFPPPIHLHTPQRCPRPSLAPQRPWEKPPGPACSAPQQLCSFRVSLLPQNPIPLQEASGPWRGLFILEPRMFLLTVQDFTRFLIVSLLHPPPPPPHTHPWPQLRPHGPQALPVASRTGGGQRSHATAWPGRRPRVRGQGNTHRKMPHTFAPLCPALPTKGRREDKGAIVQSGGLRETAGLGGLRGERERGGERAGWGQGHKSCGWERGEGTEARRPPGPGPPSW